MYKRVCNKDTRVICYNTDSIKVINPKPMVIKQKKDCELGDFHEEFSTKIRGQLMCDLPKHQTYVFENKQYKTVDTKFAETNSCVVTGMPGSGKSHAIKQIAKETDVIVSYTNSAVEELRDRRVENVHTFDSFFF